MIISLFLITFSLLINYLEEWLKVIDNSFIAFNSFVELLFGFLKYIFFGILLIIGILTLLSLRGTYFLERIRYSKEEKLEDSPMTKPRLILGTCYIVMAFGILFDWFTYFLIVVLDPLPDRLIFNFIQLPYTINLFDLNRISDISQIIYPYMKTIYYIVALFSFGAILDIVISIWHIINAQKSVRKHFIYLIGGIVGGILVGFTTCLPLFL
jgi:hypothetical protein